MLPLMVSLVLQALPPTKSMCKPDSFCEVKRELKGKVAIVYVDDAYVVAAPVGDTWTKVHTLGAPSENVLGVVTVTVDNLDPVEGKRLWREVGIPIIGIPTVSSPA